MSDRTISISTNTIFKIIIILLFLGFLYLIKDVLALIFIAVILAAAFDPMVDWFQRFKIPRALSIIAIYIVAMFFVGWSLYLLAGPITEQIISLSKAFPQFYSELQKTIGDTVNLNNLFNQDVINSGLADITRNLGKATSGIFNILGSVFGGIISLLVVLVITFYITVEENSIKKFVNSVTPVKHQPYVAKLIVDIQHRMGYWLRGQILLSFIIFLLVYIGLLILGVKYALVLALVAGVFEIVPFIGPWAAAVPAVFLSFTQSPIKALMVAILYLVIQQIEAQLITPKLMGKATGLNPLIVLIAIMIGAKLGGVAGALIGVPVALAIAVYVETLLDDKKTRDNKLSK